MGALTPILYQGAIPVFADVDPLTCNVTAESIDAMSYTSPTEWEFSRETWTVTAVYDITVVDGEDEMADDDMAEDEMADDEETSE